MSDHDNPVFASGDLVEVCGDDVDLQREIIHDFLARLDSQIDAVTDAVESGDPDAVRRAAHSLKGSSVAVGGRTVVEACLNLESLGRVATLDGARAVVERLHDQAGRLREALRSYLRAQAA
jgi:HPt (histidine-containing phosphotransfer) domain-containing protein